VVLRDLRDTLVSAYFSVLHSHALMSDAIGNMRAHLQTCSKEDGLLMLMEKWLPACALIQSSWLGSDHSVLWYEDLLERDTELLQSALMDSGLLDCAPERFAAVVAANRFDVISAGRSAGVEDLQHHNRKGVAGDWLNHFSARLNGRFQTLYGALLARYPAVRGPAPASLTAAASATPAVRYEQLAVDEITMAFDGIAALYPNVPSYVFWMASEGAAFRRFAARGRTLDHGCPDGRLATWLLSGADSLTGLTSDAAIADNARHYGRYDRIIDWEQFSAAGAAGQFDTIYSRCTLSQSDDLAATLSALRKALAPGGRLICSVLTDRLQQESCVAQLFRAHGYAEAAEHVHRQYQLTHAIRHALPVEGWLSAFRAAGFTGTRMIQVMPELSFQLFSLIDTVWHLAPGEDARMGDQVAAMLAADPRSKDGFRQIVAGLALLTLGPDRHAGAVFCLDCGGHAEASPG
jgi:SAM-dependent methyltransferase